MSSDLADPSEIRQRYLEVDVSNVSDILDELGVPDQGVATDFRWRSGATRNLAGWAFTVRGQMSAYPLKGGDPAKMAACDALTPDSVAVWAGGADGVCCFGELIALRMRQKGCVGALVDGGVRDSRWIDDQDFAVYSRYVTPVQAISRWQVTGHSIPVVVPGATKRYVTVNPGDFILGDADGAIVVPRRQAVEVLERAERLGETERLMREDLRAGMSLDEALEKYGHV